MDEDRYSLITKNLKEFIGNETQIKAIIEKRPLNIYWGTAPTGRIHVGYFIPLLKIADLVKAGCNVKILIADLHAYLDSNKTQLNKLEVRTRYYQTMIEEILKFLDVDISKITFVTGRSYQLTSEYTFDVYKLMSKTKLSQAKHAGSEVVKSDDDPLTNGLIYPMLQALDEVYLKVDGQLGGVDQRKIFMYARDFLPKIGYKQKRVHLMTPLVSALRHNSKTVTDDDKMSSSNLNGKIDLLDESGTIRKKINRTFCIPGDVDDNSLLELLQMVIFPLLEYKNQLFIVNRNEEHGGPVRFDSFNAVKQSFLEEQLYPADLKLGIYETLNDILQHFRIAFSAPELKSLLKKAY